MTNINNRLLQVLIEGEEKSPSKTLQEDLNEDINTQLEEDINELEGYTGKKVVFESTDKRANETPEELFIDADKIRFINDTRAKALTIDGLEGEVTKSFLKICDCNPRTLSTKELDTKFKAVQKWAKENLEKKPSLPTEPQDLENIEKKTKKENIMTSKKVIQEANKESQGTIKSALDTVGSGISSLTDIEKFLRKDLPWQFVKLYNPDLTALLQNLTSTREQLFALIDKIKTDLKV